LEECKLIPDDIMPFS